MWITRSNDSANKRKQSARAGMRKGYKTRAVRSWARAHEGHAQIGVWHAQARKTYAHTKGFVDVGL